MPEIKDIEAAKCYIAALHKRAVQNNYSTALELETALTALHEQLDRMNPKPLTLEELRKRDGRPVYLQYGDGMHGWGVTYVDGESICFYGPDIDNNNEPDQDFINMEYDWDPDGHFGLHLLGWRACDYPPNNTTQGEIEQKMEDK